MWIILGVIAAVLLAALTYLARQDGKYHVKRSLEIEAPSEAVFATIVDFKTWPEWSPWLMHEVDTKISYSDNYQDEGGYYSWDGKVVGAGKLSHISINPTTSLNQQIEFIRPFKSVNQVAWEFENRGEKTLVSWTMAGNMPFLFRFMTKQMEPMIGSDHELGLAQLNGYMNSAAPHPELAFIDSEELENFSYWAIPCNGNLRQLEAARQSSIEALETAATGISGLALTLYHQFDPLAAHYQAEIAISVSDGSPASNYTRREFIGGRYFKMTLRGDLRFLPLGWHALFSHCRMHKHKFDKQRPALEIYLDDVTRISGGNQFTTALYLPIK